MVDSSLDASGDWGLYVEEVAVKGRAVFAGKTIPQGSLVLKFKGPIYDRDTCPDFSEAIQVGINAWMHSSGGLDDLVNHSCDANCGLFPRPEGLYLLSLREIKTGEELSFDYSTSMHEEPWSMECACGTPRCRGTIANFLDMPQAVQDRYAELGVLPEHIRCAYNAASAARSREQGAASGAADEEDAVSAAASRKATPPPVAVSAAVC